MATNNPTNSHKTILCTYICSNIQIQSIFLHNILTNSTCTMSGQTLYCSIVLRTFTWKIVFKIENNELNELSGCMFYKMFFFSGKHLKTIKLTCTIIFQKPCLLTLKVSKAFLYLLALKVYKTLNTCLLALLYFSLKAYKTLIAYLLRNL